MAGVFCFCCPQFIIYSSLCGQYVYLFACLSVYISDEIWKREPSAIASIRNLFILITVFIWKICLWIHNEIKTCCCTTAFLLSSISRSCKTLIVPAEMFTIYIPNRDCSAICLWAPWAELLNPGLVSATFHSRCASKTVISEWGCLKGSQLEETY